MQAPLQPGQLEACAGWYRASRLLHLAVRLDVAAVLRAGPLDDAQFIAALGTHEQATRAFVEALLAWGVIGRDAGGRLVLTPVSRRLLPDAPDALGLPLVAGWAGHDAVFEAWSGLEHTLRTGESGLRRRCGAGFESRLAADARASALYQQAMSSTTAGFEACADALEGQHFEHAVDIGGGRGDLLQALLARRPQARGLCVDLPHVVQGLTPQRSGRLRFLAADATQGLPPGADLYLTSTVLRCLPDDALLALLRRVRAAMTHPQARLVCFELLRPAAPDPQAAMQNLTAHVVYGGRDRSAAEFETLFRDAGLAWVGAEPVDHTLHALRAVRRMRAGDARPRSPAPTRPWGRAAREPTRLAS